MLLRVLIVIVVVAVLGFFGTRGSEKVVAEVTERQELVDDLAKKLAKLEARNAALEEKVAKDAGEQALITAEAKRATDVLHARITELERAEAARVAAVLSTAAIKVTLHRHALLYVDEALVLDGPLGAAEPLRLSVGRHKLEVDSGQKRVAYSLLVRQASQGNRLIFDGATLRAMGDLVVTRDR